MLRLGASATSIGIALITPANASRIPSGWTHLRSSLDPGTMPLKEITTLCAGLLGGRALVYIPIIVLLVKIRSLTRLPLSQHWSTLKQDGFKRPKAPSA